MTTRTCVSFQELKFGPNSAGNARVAKVEFENGVRVLVFANPRTPGFYDVSEMNEFGTVLRMTAKLTPDSVTDQLYALANERPLDD